MERLSLIDVAAEDDILTSSPCGGLIYQISPVIVCSKEDVSQVKISKQMEEALKLSDSPEQNRTKSGKYNLRKSLAWDSAFFTSEGVLNHEELAIVNSTFKKSEACSLAVIQEDVRRSTESTSTLDNDSWALESIEVDLFENVRASIQKTLGSGEKSLKLANPCKKNNPVKEGALPFRSSKKVEPSSHNMKKSPVASDRNAVSNRHEHTSKGATVVANAGANGIRSSKILSKPPRVLSRAAMPTMPTKKSNVQGNNQISSGTKDMRGNAVSQKSVMGSKKTNGGTCSGSSKPSQSLKPTLNLVNNSTGRSHKSPLEKTRMGSTSTTISRSSSGSGINKTSLRTSRAKIVSRNTSNPAISPKSAFKLSSTASPSSSFDSVVSGSSSSTLSAIKPLVDNVEYGSSSPSLEGADSDRVQSPGPKLYLSSEDLRDHSHRVHVGKSSPDNVKSEPSRGNPRSCTNDSSGPKCYKPSGLKMPTPKIGYFDAARQQPNLLKGTTDFSKTDSANKVKLSKVQHVTPATEKTAITSDSPQAKSTVLFRHATTESPSLKQQSKLVGSTDLTGTPVAQAESCPIVEDFCPMKDDSLFKVCEGAAQVINNTESSGLQKSSTKEQAGDLHPKNMANIQMESESMVLSDRSSGLTRKHMEMDSCTGQEPQNRKNYHCDSPTVNMEKENLYPVL